MAAMRGGAGSDDVHSRRSLGQRGPLVGRKEPRLGEDLDLRDGLAGVPEHLLQPPGEQG